MQVDIGAITVVAQNWLVTRLNMPVFLGCVSLLSIFSFHPFFFLVFLVIDPNVRLEETLHLPFHAD